MMSRKPSDIRHSRRDALRLAGAAGAAAIVGASPSTGLAEEAPWRHAVSLMGTPRYPEGFRHFEHVNPQAPKAGLLRLGAQGTFDNFNPFVEGVKGELENGIESLLCDTLLVASEDEVATEYGLIAEALSYPADFAYVAYRLRPEAKFQDGSPITPADVIFSFETLKANRPTYAFYYHNVSKAEQTGPHEVTFTFSQKGNRELPQIVGQMPVLSKAWWTGTGANGQARDPKATTLEPPLGSGRYRLKAFDPGRYAVYELVPDYWARDLNVSVGRNNFREIRFEYFRDSTVLLEAFKADSLDFRAENSARNWATAYEFPAVVEGRVIKEEFPVRASGVMQAFVPNLRRPRFADRRVRRALNLAFDFEDTNRTLFYGLYERVDSFFFGTELASSGLPEGLEREILDSVKDKVPASVFTAPYRNPVSGNSEAVRNNLREAVRLLTEAGFELRGRQLVEKRTGEPFRIEILGYDQSTERFVLPYRAALERIGIAVDLRVVDAAQYQNRLRAFDFDMTTSVWAQSLSPGNEQREYWGSAAADRPGSRNLPGIKDPGVDALIERIVYAKDRTELVATTRALDRVLLAHEFVIPQWSSRVTRTARWNRFGRPSRLPEYAGSGFPTIWWYDEALATKTGAAR